MSPDLRPLRPPFLHRRARRHHILAARLVLFLALLLAPTPAPASNATLPSAPARVLLRQVDRAPCRTKCRFLACRGLQTTLLSAPGRPAGPTICRRGQDIENIVATGEALVDDGSRPPRLVRISKWRPPGLAVPFHKRYFFTKPIPGRGGLSGITRRPARNNQNAFLHDVCLTLPIRRYERNLGGKVVVVEAGRPKDCVAVLLQAPTIVIEAFWFSGDDFDLALVEPGGKRVDNRNREATCGRFVRDNNVDTCGIFDSGRERVTYTLPCDGFKKGKYTAILRHSANCQFGPTTYEIRVVVKGRLKTSISGVSNADGGTKVRSFDFRLP